MGKDSNWGYMPYLTADQKAMLAELRKRVDAELPKKEWLAKDTSLLRFCRARNFNPSKTWNMLKEDVEWREPFEGYVYCRNRDFGGAYAMHEEGAIRYAGKAKDGRPVVMIQARYYWPKLIEDNIQIVYFFQFYVDAICRMAEEVGQETFYAIADLEGFSMANFSLAQMKIAIGILQNHYPERLGMFFVINAPFVFTAAWRLIQPLLDERTRNKVEILGSNYFEAITQHIDADQIEKPWGGTHEKWPIPDEIVQIAIDNEKKLLEAQTAAVTATSVSVNTVSTPTSEKVLTATAPPMTPSRTPSGNLETKSVQDVTGSRRSLGVRKSVRRMMKKMLFITDKRALANSMGVDPDAPEMDAPKRLAVATPPLTSPTRGLKSKSGGALGTGNDEEEDVDPTVDLERDLFEVKEAHDKLLVKVEALEKLVVSEKKSMTKGNSSLQKQVIILASFLMAILALLVREKLLALNKTSVLN